MILVHVELAVKKLAVALLLLSTLGFPCNAEDDPGSGNYLLEVCTIAVQPGGPKKMPTEIGHANYCLGFVSAILSVGDALPAEARFCIPLTVTSGQAMAVLVKFLKANPEMMHHRAAALAAFAFRQAWPCK